MARFANTVRSYSTAAMRRVCQRCGFLPAARHMLTVLLVGSLAGGMMTSAVSSKNKHYCQVLLVNSGTIRAAVDNLTISSKEIGASAGKIQVITTNSSYRISIDNTAGFTSMPIGGSDSTNFKTFYSGFGATNFSETPGNVQIKVKKGVTDIETHFVAERFTEPFPAGAYTANLSVRCE